MLWENWCKPVGFPVSTRTETKAEEKNVESEGKKVCIGVSLHQNKYRVYQPGARNNSILEEKNEQYYPCCCEKMLNIISD